MNTQQQNQLLKAKEVAQSRNGQCISTIYVNVKEKLEWKCAKHNRWSESYHNVVNIGHWCPECAGLTFRK